MKLFIATLLTLFVVGTNGASANGATCALDTGCESGFCSVDFTCKDKKAVGESCIEDDDCITALCSVDFTCKEKLAVNQTCIEDDDCQSGNCEQLGGFKCAESSGYLAWNLTRTLLFGIIASFMLIAF